MFKFRNRHEVADKAMAEGLGYFIMHYCNSEAMPDDELKEAFEKAETAISEFEDLLPEVEEA